MDNSDDHLARHSHSAIELLNWLAIDERRLSLVLADCPAAAEQERADAVQLVASCLQREPARRPTMSQILAHRFLQADAAPPPPLLPRFHYFISHMQKEASDLVHLLFYMLSEAGCKCWVDMEAQNLTEVAIELRRRHSLACFGFASF